MNYQQSGVDIEAGYRAVSLMKDSVQSTLRPEVLTSLGGFAGAFSAEAFKGMRHPVLLSGTDGVGTKTEIAIRMGVHDTIGIDCVAMCVNDIAAQGAEPLFFLDYIACGKNVPETIADIVKGVAAGCKEAGCALIGGETAEHPGLMPETDYDLAGFAVGVAEREEMIDGSAVREGDALIGIASSGVHANGFSLVRRILKDQNIALTEKPAGFDKTVGEVLLAPTRIYVKALRAVKEAGVSVRGISHITGGGFYENIPRMLPEGISARIQKDSFPLPEVFAWLRAEGGLEERDMYNTFNMGLGMVLAVSKEDADKTVQAVASAGESAFLVGETFASEQGVELC
ncbi:MAG: phosphoribosylformylglycinamidine cyclo-ligase [Lachnospiraceae bacterium]|nr:phosphoribosylformylglycinamidine cyclo-ligase [Lachnospiraceae bacterium]